MKVLLTGAKGQLGRDFQKLFKRLGVNHFATDHKELNITDEIDIIQHVERDIYTHIINCAAYNEVDKAESEIELCRKLNTEAPMFLVKAAKRIGALYMTYSSDFVFDGKQKKPYKETDIPNPLSVYGKSKLDGEKLVLEEYTKSFVVRTSWVFGVGNNNFNKQVINWSRDRDKLNIVDDQVSSPTYSYDLALYSWFLMQTGKFGLYHLSNCGECSKKEQAEYLLNAIGWKGEIVGAKTTYFNLPAKRAKYSKLDSSKLERTINKKIPSWQSGIDRFLNELKEVNR